MIKYHQILQSKKTKKKIEKRDKTVIKIFLKKKKKKISDVVMKDIEIFLKLKKKLVEYRNNYHRL